MILLTKHLVCPLAFPWIHYWTQLKINENKKSYGSSKIEHPQLFFKDASYSAMAPTGQLSAASWAAESDVSATKAIALPSSFISKMSGAMLAQSPQPMHRSWSTTGFIFTPPCYFILQFYYTIRSHLVGQLILYNFIIRTCRILSSFGDLRPDWPSPCRALLRWVVWSHVMKLGRTNLRSST